jgi:hypothetical protein
MLVHSYTLPTGESVEINLLLNGKLVVDVDGAIIHVESAPVRRRYTPRTAKRRAFEYEKQHRAAEEREASAHA